MHKAVAVNTEGANRVVILAWRWAIKLPRLRAWRYGRANNRNEARWCRDHLDCCPVLWRAPFGLALIMPRAVPLTDVEFERHCGTLPAIAGVERKASSWGRLDGRIVAIDYGWR